MSGRRTFKVRLTRVDEFELTPDLVWFDGGEPESPTTEDAIAHMRAELDQLGSVPVFIEAWDFEASDPNDDPWYRVEVDGQFAFEGKSGDHPSTKDGVCLRCGSGVLESGKHLRDDLPPCYGQTFGRLGVVLP